MGRTQPTKPAPIPKHIRAKHARETIHKSIPALLSSSPRAHHGVQSSELITSPTALPFTPSPTITTTTRIMTTPSSTNPASPRHRPPLKIRILHTDALTAAASLSSPPAAPKHRTTQNTPSIAILNPASPLRPGSGVLKGSTSSPEEDLCLRTTLYPSLHEHFYRLPETGGIWTPDIMVFRDAGDEELAKDKRFYVGVLSAAMLRFPETEVSEDGEEGYADPRDRETMLLKMRAVMRLFAVKGVRKVVLGAWGCGAYGNPVGEIARGWRKVLVGGRKGRELFGKVEEVVFAVGEGRMVDVFRRCFEDVVVGGKKEGEVEDNDEDSGRSNSSSS